MDPIEFWAFYHDGLSLVDFQKCSSAFATLRPISIELALVCFKINGGPGPLSPCWARAWARSSSSQSEREVMMKPLIYSFLTSDAVGSMPSPKDWRRSPSFASCFFSVNKYSSFVFFLLRPKSFFIKSQLIERTEKRLSSSPGRGRRSKSRVITCEQMNETENYSATDELDLFPGCSWNSLHLVKPWLKF